MHSWTRLRWTRFSNPERERSARLWFSEPDDRLPHGQQRRLMADLERLEGNVRCITFHLLNPVALMSFAAKKAAKKAVWKV